MSDRTVLLRPVPGLLVLAQALGQTEHFAVINLPGEAGVTVFFVCYTAVKHRKAALHSPRTASQHRNGNGYPEREGVKRCAQVPQCLETPSTLARAKAACFWRDEKAETPDRR